MTSPSDSSVVEHNNVTCSRFPCIDVSSPICIRETDWWCRRMSVSDAEPEGAFEIAENTFGGEHMLACRLVEELRELSDSAHNIWSSDTSHEY